MPVRTIDTRLSKLIEMRRRSATRPGRPLPAAPAPLPDDEDRRRAVPAQSGRRPAARPRILPPLAGVVVTVLLASVLFAPGAIAHVGTEFAHLWNEHIKPRIATPGTINATSNPVDWSKLKGVPASLADGLDNAVDQAASASGGGPNPTAALQFFGLPATVAVSHAGQRVLVTSDNGFGSGVQAASGLNLTICYRALPSGALTPAGGSSGWIAGNSLPPNTRVTMGMSRILQLSAGSQYLVGLCGTGGSGWTNNDWGSTTALVFST